MSTRRVFLRNSAMAMVGVGALPAWLGRAVYAAEGGNRKKVLVAIFQRGAADGLNIVVPYVEKRYYDLRPTIAVPKTNVIELDGFFGLHPSLAPLKPIYDSGRLAIVQAAGSPDPTRSHFDAQDYMESGTPGRKATRDGWMNRALGPHASKATGKSLPTALSKPSPVRAVAVGQALPRSMRGLNPAVALSNIGDFKVGNEQASDSFMSMYSTTADATLHGPGKDTFEAVKLLESIQRQRYTPSGGASYPRSRLGGSLTEIARLIKADVGVEVAFADIGGWDHHVNEVGLQPTQGQLPNLLTDFGQALAAFWQDLGDRAEDVTLVTMSEFGRTARENGNRGTDHGHANCMFVMGGDVAGGKIYGRWPGLEQEQLHEGRDLALTTDFRDVLGELVSRHLGNRNVPAVFPGYQVDPQRFRGLIRVTG